MRGTRHTGDLFHEKKQYTDADRISTPRRGDPDCRLYAEFDNHVIILRYHNRVGDGKRTGSGRNAVRYSHGRRDQRYCTLRDAPGRDDEQHRALGNHAVGHTAGRDDERHSSLWCCTLG